MCYNILRKAVPKEDTQRPLCSSDSIQHQAIGTIGCAKPNTAANCPRLVHDASPTFPY